MIAGTGSSSTLVVFRGHAHASQLAGCAAYCIACSTVPLDDRLAVLISKAREKNTKKRHIISIAMSEAHVCLLFPTEPRPFSCGELCCGRRRLSSQLRTHLREQLRDVQPRTIGLESQFGGEVVVYLG